MKIAVFGSAAGDMSSDVNEKARKIGSEIASSGHILITGGCPGYPHQAAKGAHAKNGQVIGFSPAVDIEQHKAYGYPVEEYSELVFVPKEFKHLENRAIRTKYRNVMSTAECDACIIIGGRSGTLNEFTIAYDAGKKIGVLLGSGGITKFIKKLVDDFNKPTKYEVIYDTDPVELVRRLTR